MKQVTEDADKANKTHIADTLQRTEDVEGADNPNTDTITLDESQKLQTEQTRHRQQTSHRRQTTVMEQTTQA